MSKSSIMIDLDDPRTAKIADVISNKTSKRILNELTEKELSEGELAKSLNLPMNTIGYNVKKLESSGLIEKIKGFYWSEKGKKVYKYRVSNKKIVITPKSLLKGFIPTILITGFIALGLKIFFYNKPVEKGGENILKAVETEESSGSASIVIDKASDMILPPNPDISNVVSNCNSCPVWAWFLLGALIAILIILIWNSYKMKGGKKHGK